MKRFVSSMLVMLCLSVSAVAMAEVKIWGADELQASGKLINISVTYRDTALQPFNPTENAMIGVKEAMNKKGVANAYIAFEGELYEKNVWGLSGKYFVVEATAFEFLEPTADNVRVILNKNNVGSYEAKIATGILVKSDFAHSMAPLLLDKIKNSASVANNGEIAESFTSAYVEITKQDSVDELRKLLKYHRSVTVQITAGKALIALGDRQTVENFVDGNVNKKSQLVRNLTKVLAK